MMRESTISPPPLFFFKIYRLYLQSTFVSLYLNFSIQNEFFVYHLWALSWVQGIEKAALYLTNNERVLHFPEEIKWETTYLFLLETTSGFHKASISAYSPWINQIPFSSVSANFPDQASFNVLISQFLWCSKQICIHLSEGRVEATLKFWPIVIIVFHIHYLI